MTKRMEDTRGNKGKLDHFIFCTSMQFEFVANFHLGETLTALQKATLTPGGYESLVYSTIMGSIGALVPLLTKDEVK